MYSPTDPPQMSGDDGQALVGYVFDELREIAASLQGISQGQYLPILYVAPEKPREPQVVFADGTKWNPGSGKGLYVYYNSAWHFAG